MLANPFPSWVWGRGVLASGVRTPNWVGRLRERGVFQPQKISIVTFWVSGNNILGLKVTVGFIFPKGK